MKKSLIIISFLLSLLNTIYSQDSKILNYTKKYYFDGNYKGVISFVDSFVKKEEIKEKEIWSEIYLYYAFSCYKTGKDYLAIIYIEDLLNIKPDFELIENRFDKEIVALFNETKKENVGSLKVITAPDSADVFIDREYKGKSPLFIKDLYSDIYTISLLKSRHKIITKEVFIEPDNVTNIYETLRWTDYYSLVIYTKPEGVEVNLDKKYLGTTPLIVEDLLAGNYRLTLKKKYYKKFSEIINIPYYNSSQINIKLDRVKDYFLYSIFAPGFGQIKMGNYKHGILFCATTVGYFAYYNYFNKTEPEWEYKEKVFSRGQTAFGGSYIFKINGEVVDYRVYYREMAKKEEEEKEVRKFEDRRWIIRSIGLFLYTVNLFDTWFLMDKNKETGLDLSLGGDSDYVGLSLNFIF